MLSVTKVFQFEAAHAISNHNGPCRHIHGHSYKLHVTVTSARLNDLGMIMDFGELKEVVNKAVISRFDHALILSRTGSHAATLAANAAEGKLVLLEAEPTAEYLLDVIVAGLRSLLPAGVSLLRLELWETSTSCATWEKD